MRSVFAAALFWLPAALALGCDHRYEARDASQQAADARSETRWLREEVQSLRASLAERDRREAEMWRAYVDLAQRVGTLHQANESVKPPTPTAVLGANTVDEVAEVQCVAAPASDEANSRKSILRAINQSQLTVREKRQLLQSMRPPRAIDIVNPWDPER